MALYPPRTPGTDAFIRIYNNDGSEAGACGNGMRCVAGAASRSESGKDALTFETDGRHAQLLEGRRRPVHRRHGRRRASRWNEIPLAEEFRDTRAIELQIGPIDKPVLHSPSVVNMGNPHAIFWVDDVNAYDLARFGPLLENHPIFPERANITLAHIVVARAHRHPHLGARRRADQGLRLGRLRGRGRGGAAQAHRAQGARDAARRRPDDRMARERRPRADDRPGRIRVRRHVRSRSCSRKAARAVSVDVVTFGCRLNILRVGSDPARGRGRGRRRRRRRQHLRGDRRSGAAGAAGDPQRSSARQPDARIVVTGCAAQTEPAHFAAMPEVDRVLGNEDKFEPRAPGPAATRVAVTDIMACDDDARARDRRASRAARAPSCRCRTAATTAAPSASSRSAAAIRARCRSATWSRRRAAWSPTATARSC